MLTLFAIAICFLAALWFGVGFGIVAGRGRSSDVNPDLAVLVIFLIAANSALVFRGIHIGVLENLWLTLTLFFGPILALVIGSALQESIPKSRFVHALWP